jgi:hypothetical protein
MPCEFGRCDFEIGLPSLLGLHAGAHATGAEDRRIVALFFGTQNRQHHYFRYN